MTKTNTLAEFIATRVKRLSDRKSQKDIARETGFANPNFVSMIKSGAAKLALEHVKPLAKSLECDKRALMRLALKQYYGPELIHDITHCDDPLVTEDEFGLIATLRKLVTPKS